MARRNVLSAIKCFRKAGLLDAEESAQYLLAHVLGSTSISTSRSAVAKNLELTQEQLSHFTDLCKRRVNREPLQYIVGNWDFFTLRNLLIKPPCLVPRPETEEFVSLVLTDLKKRYPASSRGSTGSSVGLYNLTDNPTSQANKKFFLEIGIGTGAISLSLLQELDKSWCGIAIDVSEDAVALAEENAKLQQLNERLCVLHLPAQALWPSHQRLLPADVPLEARMTALKKLVSFLHSHLPNTPRLSQLSEPFHPLPLHALVSNPPYLPPEDMTDDKLQAELKFEDPRALNGFEPVGLGLILDILYSLVDREREADISSETGNDLAGGSESDIHPPNEWFRLVDNAPLWFETHTTHPSVIYNLLQSPNRTQVSHSIEEQVEATPSEKPTSITTERLGHDAKAEPGTSLHHEMLKPASGIGSAQPLVPETKDTHEVLSYLEKQFSKRLLTGQAAANKQYLEKLRKSLKWDSAYTDFRTLPRFVCLRWNERK